jgi:chromate transporter
MGLFEFSYLVCGFNALALGNGPIMLALIRKSFIEVHGVLSPDQLLSSFAVAQIVPGQANLYMAGIGYKLFGLIGGLLAAVALVVPGYIMLPLVKGYRRFQRVAEIRGFVRGLTCASVGLVVAAAMQMGRNCLTQPLAWVVFLLTLALAQGLKWNSVASLLTASSVGLLLRLWLVGVG